MKSRFPKTIFTSSLPARFTGLLFALLLGLLCWGSSTLSAAEAETALLYVRNNFSNRIHVWANGSLQGYVDPGIVAYMPREGFVTLDSGVQPDGSVKVEHAYGGWEGSGLLKIEAYSGVISMGTPEKPYVFGATISVPQKSENLYIWFGGEPEITGEEIEFARKMPQSGVPGPPWRSILEEGGRPLKEEEGGGKRVATGGSGGASAALYVYGAGKEKEEEKQEEAGKSYTSSVGAKMIWVDKGYYLAETEVTQGQYQAVMGSNPSGFKGSKNPVEQVNWHEAMEYCRRLTEKDRAAGKLPKGYVYTLPSEAQWEYACRAGTAGDYAGPLDEMAWYENNSGKTTHPVATKRPNKWGFYDMHGNVTEWCIDSKDSGRADRGGSWLHDAENCRAGSRNWYFGIFRYNTLGFRPAAVPSSK